MAVAKEVWTANIATSGAGIGAYWSDNVPSASPTWHKVASLPFPAADLINIYITRYGERMYVFGANSNHSGHHEIWKSDNPKAGSPTWTKILEAHNDSILGAMVDHVDLDTTADRTIALDPVTGTLAVIAATTDDRTIYGEYASNAWTWTVSLYWEGAFGSTGEMDYRIGIKNIGGGTWDVYQPPSTFVDEVIGPGDAPYGLFRAASKSSTMFHTGSTSTWRVLIAGTTGFNYNDATHGLARCLDGAFDGTEVLLVTSDGYFVRSADGSAANQTATWAGRTNNQQFICDLNSEGDGLLIWMSTITAAGVCIRGSTDGGATWNDYNGDMLSAFATDNLFKPASIRLVYEAVDFTNAPRLTQSLVIADGIGLRAQSDGAIATFDEIHGTAQDLQVDSGVTLHVYGVQYDPANSNIVGTLDPLPGDRAAWDALAHANRHTNDADDPAGIHHTLTGLDSRYASKSLTSAHLLVGNAGNVATDRALSGDATIDNVGALTLANSGVSAATYGDATHVPQVAVDAKGRVTAASNVAITAGHAVQDNGTPLTTRANLNITGVVKAIDDPGNNATIIKGLEVLTDDACNILFDDSCNLLYESG